MILALMLLAQTPLPPMLTRDGGWVSDGADDDVTIERREVPGSGIPELKVTKPGVRASVTEACDALFEWATKRKHAEHKLHTVLEDGTLERVVYDQIDVTLVSNRDYALTVRRSPPTDATCRIDYWATNSKAPRRPEGFVRMEKLWGTWTLEPQADGRLRVSYQLFGDPGGSVPSMFVRSAQKTKALETLRIAVKHLEPR